MAHLDRFIEALKKRDGERLVVATGEPVTLVTGDGEIAVTNKPTTAAQIEFLLQEVARAAMSGSGNAGAEPDDFTYDSPAGVVRVMVSRDNGSRAFEVVPVDMSESGAAPVLPEAAGGSETPGGSEAAGESEPVAGSPPVTASGPSADREPSASSPHSDNDGARSAMEALLRRTVKTGSSDLHISAENPPMCRKDGSMMVPDEASALTAEQTRSMLLSIAPARNREQFEQRHDTDFAYEIAGLARFRANLFMDRKGPGGVFRVIPSDIITADQLGLSGHVLDLCRLSKGLVLVTGPTGSGKSTTLAAMMNHINETRDDHIITIEDPIEFVHPNKRCLINQREVGVHTDSFKVALRAALREDPDIVLVGELRDLETVEIALETAETGHLVFGTLHTTTAAATVDRIIDQFPPGQQNQIRMMLAETLRGVIAQTLCKKKTGGRTAAMEILIVNPAIANLIREGKTYQVPSAMQTGRNTGMRTLTTALVDLVTSGEVDPREAYMKAVDRKDLQGALARAGVQLDLPGAPENEGAK